ncbi:MAG TPA: tetratricopeptide repeat protein [Polyangiaceae bacterium]|nr:tetratricopeptide repeat protein [Polyangiaceae bacterium]
MASLPPVSSSRTSLAPLPAEPLTEVTCRAWASQARPQRAVDCYQTIARESGIGAEVALYEAARLSAEALDDAPRALALIEQHSTRFPNSALRVEVQWLKIRSLERAGRLDEALAASEALLDSAVGRSLAPKLHLLRGRIYSGVRQQCALALPEYVALLGEPGPAGDEAEFNRAQCLEQLQRPAEARAAYQRYLSRPDARSAEAARTRLMAIANSTQHSEGQP